MAITTTYKEVYDQFVGQARRWESFEKYEEFYLRYIQETRPDTNYYTGSDGVERKISFIDHHPELKLYEVWIEGYAATGERSGATLVGSAKARNFAQACDMVMCESRLMRIKMVNSPEYKEYCPPERWSYEPSKLSSWACRLFWSEELAKMSFG